MDLAKNTDHDREERRQRRRWGLIPRWLEVLAICTATVAAGFFGGRVTVVQADGPKPAVTVTATVTATPEPEVSTKGETDPPTEDPTTTSEPGTSEPGTPENSSSVYLADLEPVEGDRSVQPITIRGQHYPKSLTLTCDSNGTSVVYSTSGYSRLEAKTGIVADSPNAIGSTATIKVANSAGNPIGDDVIIQSSKATDLSVDVSGHDQIEITCVLTKSGDDSGWYVYGGLGDATLS
ncbi:hypothetical protein Sipo8835_20150 [Streptomyces ipomoeae]|jgi:hypothetical protein|uniref:Glycosyl hydrolase family 98 putative carbohydrate-binding module domain-containing protein n=3 Tax=Streptomyces ipomoeae TaxID=103232 RepID=L1KPN2_9ACTN|nr:NPCBM/NEW2 domain-containing protein [Streptomyces ipomoeae]EKX62756.1 hypothetical protein STRIP9103_02149 [Streptomyces ipomoeae 91-03]MDX2696377.1 NPCBM/NEW2 domain-containing protein [Streptomyces ipomoeae]MDX2823995.1 NPCBM/NEW2 domain-containing protein [Streptomyces ipomoeae]MDX2845833.1 NPCBM/NEW2 domain-containing protein [Streptomyces ipomoeae]MDX2931016.1 NPCBM/NEW2 domain-containing protein [Streptomyces ipomoeae]